MTTHVMTGDMPVAQPARHPLRARPHELDHLVLGALVLMVMLFGVAASLRSGADAGRAAWSDAPIYSAADR